MDRKAQHDIARGLVERRHLLVNGVHRLGLYQIRLCRRRENAHSKRLRENQNVPRPRAGIGEHPFRMHKARDRQAVNWLRAVDGVAARDDRARLIGLVVAAAQNFTHGFVVHRVRQTHDIERQLRLAAHRVHIAQRVRCGDLAVQKRVIDDRREKVRRLNDGRVVRYHIHARVVALIVADDEARVRVRAEAVQHLDERSRADLCPAARAGGELCQFHIRFHVHAPRCCRLIRIRPPAPRRSGRPLPRTRRRG